MPIHPDYIYNDNLLEGFGSVNRWLGPALDLVKIFENQLSLIVSHILNSFFEGNSSSDASVGFLKQQSTLVC